MIEMAQCDYCTRETKHPRGTLALDEGWHVAELVIGKKKTIVIACPDHVSEFSEKCDKLLEEWKSNKGKNRS